MSATRSEDVEALKRQLAEREAEIALMRAELMSKDAVIERLKFQLAVARRAQFGQSSEKLDREIDQLELQLEELETAAAMAPSIATAASEVERGQPVRKPLPDHLPRQEIMHAAPCVCPQCGGKLSKLGEDATEILDYAPARFRVIRHVRPKFSCRSCEAICQAPMPSLPIERGRPGPGLLAHVLVSKFCDHIPLYRQSEIFAREGVELERSTLADWVGASAALLDPLVEALRRDVLAGPVLHGDDTPVPVLAPGNGKTREGRFWVYVRDERPHCGERAPGVAYFYSPDRKGERPQAHLKDFAGVLHADGYAGFNKLYEHGRIQSAACWAHVRRKFFDVAKSLNSPLAKEALDKIGALYGIEADIRGQPPDRRVAVRLARASPMLDEFRAWLGAQMPRLSKKSDLFYAMRYARTRWTALTAYVADGRLEIDNSAAERALRGVALGRKNYLFMGSDAGGERAAAIYSLIESAKLNGVEPQAYLTDVLSRIADHPINSIGELLPWRITDAKQAAA